MVRVPRIVTAVEHITTWVGSVESLVLHTIVFILFFALSFAGFLSWDLMFLILTTVVSLEAIYLAIFIQMTVNRQARELAEVSEDVDEIQEDIEEISEDIDEIQEDVEEINDDEGAPVKPPDTTVEQLSAEVRRLVAAVEALKHTP